MTKKGKMQRLRFSWNSGYCMWYRDRERKINGTESSFFTFHLP